MNITPTEEYKALAGKVGVPRLFLKREDLHPLGSHKGRSIPTMIDAYLAEGFKKFSISSSGNAGIAAARYIQKLNVSRGGKISLEIYIGEHIGKEKKDIILALADEHIRVSEKDRPLQAFLQSIKLSEVKGLRQSTDDLALAGYESLAKELLQIPELSDVFVATSSGTTAQALGEYFIKNGKRIAIHIVQTSSCHPMAEGLPFGTGTKGSPSGSAEISIADAIVDKTAFRRTKVVDVIKKTSGSAWVADNSEIRAAQNLLAENNVPASPNGALALAGLLKGLSQQKKYSGSVACIIGGK